MRSLFLKQETLFILANIAMLILIIPVLILLVFIGNNMDYWVYMKMQTLRSNLFLFAVVVVCFLMYLFLAKWINNKIDLSHKRNNFIINLILILLFVGIYFVNIEIVKEIAFRLPWDIMVARGAALEIAAEQSMGYQSYFSMYSNNIPIAYILGKLYNMSLEWKQYELPAEFFWIQINCVFLSVAGYFCCLTVKKLTQKVMPIMFALVSYLGLVAMSAWKMAPYTDTYGIVFPIMSIYFYISYKDTNISWKKMLWIILSLFLAMMGGFIKPSLYIVIVAIGIIEMLGVLEKFKENIIWLCITCGLLVIFSVGTVKYKEYIITNIGLEFNQEVEQSWHHYFLMGLNEETTGGYNSEDVGLVGEYQDNKAERIKTELKLATDRIAERGFAGTIYFWLRKMVMTFNDGTFGWRTEVWVDSYYDELASDNDWTQFLRSIYWEGSLVGVYNTICQFLWIFVIVCIPGVCFVKGDTRKKYIILTIVFLGIFMYQMLFEARARYLFVFLPVLILISACGIEEYTNILLRKKTKV